MAEAPKAPTPPALKPQTPTPGDDVRALAPDDRIAEQLDRIMRDKGTEGGLRVLYDDNLDVRQKNAKLRELVQEVRNQLPPAGAIILTGDDATHYAALVELKVPLAEVADRLKTGKGSEAEATVAQLHQQQKHAEAARLLNWNAQLLTELATDKRITIDVIDATVADKPVRVPVVVTDPAKNESVGLADYDVLKPYLPSLRLDASLPEPTAPKPKSPTPPAPRVLKQHSGAQGAVAQPDMDKLVERVRATGGYSRF